MATRAWARRAVARAMICGAPTLTSAAGCGPKNVAAPPPQTRAPVGGPWTSTIDVAHPLVGRIWNVKREEFVDDRALIDAADRAHYVLLGEKHDNPDHHRLQATVVRGLVARGRSPALAFEMLDLDRQRDVDQAIASTPKDPDAIARAVQWQNSGWPAWAWYRPIAEPIVAAGLPIVAANFPTKSIKLLFTPTPPALDHGTAARMAVDEPLPAELQKSLEAELKASHCGQLSEATLPKMVLAQRLRDGAMAERLAETDTGKERAGEVLIAGNGHVRLDRGVPRVLRLKGAGSSVQSVAFLEVATGKNAAADYAQFFHTTSLPFDFVWFTPRIDDEDLCARTRASGH